MLEEEGINPVTTEPSFLENHNDGRRMSDDRRKRSRIMTEKETDRSIFERFTGKTPNRLTDQLRDIAPDAEKWIHDFVFGTVYARDGLTAEEKAVATITTLAALGGCERELRSHIQTALNVGVAPELIVATFLHMAPYAGFPRTLNALFTAKEVFEFRGVTVSGVAKAEEGEETK